MIIPQITILGLDELANQQEDIWDYIISIVDPQTNPPALVLKHAPLRTLKLSLWDWSSSLLSENLEPKHGPKENDVIQILHFGNMIAQEQRRLDTPLKILCHCHSGVSRSAAAAIILLNQWFGPGFETQIITWICQNYPNVKPNRLLIQWGDQLLLRNGLLLASVDEC